MLFISNLAPIATEKDLYGHFREAGLVFDFLFLGINIQEILEVLVLFDTKSNGMLKKL